MPLFSVVFKSMRIGVDIRCLMESHYSGISEYTHNLLRHVLAIDHDNQYILFYNASQPGALPEFNQRNVSLRGFHYPNKIFNLAIRFLKIASLDRLIGGVDVFIIPNFLFINLSKQCKKLIVVHDLSFELYPQFFTFKKRIWHRLINPRGLCKTADRIVAISANTRRDLIDHYGVPGEKIKVIYQGIHEHYFEPVTQASRDRVAQRYHLPQRYILYLGNLEPRKNIDGLIAAFERVALPDVTLVIAGSHAWKYRAVYKRWHHSPARDRIMFLGYVAGEDKPALYAGAAAFVYPSMYEGFGLPPVEAMACGTPVITSASSSLPEAVGTAALLVDPFNIADIASAITQVLTDSHLSALLSERGKQQAAHFRWPAAAAAFLNSIEALHSGQ